MNLTKYKQWMKAATVEQKSTAAEKADTSLAHLYQLSTGFRKASPDLAARVEKGIEVANRGTELPVIRRGDLAETCAKCPFYKDCEK
jgi:hypothetical protein